MPLIVVLIMIMMTLVMARLMLISTYGDRDD